MVLLKRRKPWLAALLSFLCPGLGQLYNGSWQIALGALFLGALLSLYSVVYLFDSLSSLVKAMLLGLLFDLLLTAHAWWQAKKAGDAPMRLFHRWWIYLGFAVLVYGVPDGYGTIMPSRIQSFQIPSESMLPTLLVGDRLVADGWSYWGADPKRGDVIVFDYPKDPAIKYVKRVVGLPGDKVEFRAGELYINGSIVEQSRTGRPNVFESGWEHVEFTENLEGVRHIIYRAQPMIANDFPPVVVPEGQYFVLGDNRDRSNDSRFWGFVPRAAVIAQMKYVYWSWSAKEKSIRWDRIGKMIY